MASKFGSKSVGKLNISAKFQTSESDASKKGQTTPKTPEQAGKTSGPSTPKTPTQPGKQTVALKHHTDDKPHGTMGGTMVDHTEAKGKLLPGSKVMTKTVKSESKTTKTVTKTSSTHSQDGGKGTTKTVTTTEQTTTKTKDSGSGKVSTTTSSKTSQEVVQNGDIGNTEEIRFDEMSNIKSKFESGQPAVKESQERPNVQEEIMTVEGGVYENQPVRDPDIVREADRQEEELPEVGYTKNILNRYKQIESEKAQPVTSQRRLTPDRDAGPTELVSEPRSTVPQHEQKLEGGIFENQPVYEEGVVRSFDAVEDVKPEEGYAKNVLAKFKEIESTTKNKPPPSPKKELTPDRFTKGEYVSEPRTVFEKYEGKTEAGIFESQPAEAKDIVKSGEVVEEPLPERGTAKNLASKFAQYESQAKSPPSPHQKKELTPDRFTKGEYVSEPRTVFQHYEAKEESGIYESNPEDRPEVVKSGDYMEEPLPEQGYAKNVISRFREIQAGTSPVSTPQRPREITPPRGDTFSGVIESTPQENPDVVKSDQHAEEVLPESGMAKNLVNKFRQIQTTSQSPTSPRQKKEFTPPPQSGVYENTPQKSLVVENRPAESGILETTPTVREGVAREGDVSTGDIEFPEQGYAKNMVSKWKQIENDSAKSTPSPRYKEFTPPRDDVRTARGPLSPRSPAGVDSSVHPNDLPGQYHEQVSPGIFESNPQRREDILREEDTDWSEGLPKEGTSKSLINKFKQVQEDAKKSSETPKPVSRKDSTDDSAPQTPTQMFEQKNENEAVRNGVRSSPLATEEENVDTHTDAPVSQSVDRKPEGAPKSTFAVQLDKCPACQKTVYAMEKVEMNKNIYHRACFKCSHCNCRLTAKTFSLNEGVMYCTNHFKQLFARKGNYDEGFGRQQHKKRWGGDQPDEQSHSQNSA
ncbi:hypothetical protein FSP39_021937 [Pinctada imbricata]|uniref:LIM zinc-binding domain-containing protein n=1 Tax=Pinctada imbricata TaxID=66713 RepID=A0AA88YF47_PINIB|nr:hypothetical protein FSP39_021937 [Pinctada imbricata]